MCLAALLGCAGEPAETTPDGPHEEMPEASVGVTQPFEDGAVSEGRFDREDLLSGALDQELTLVAGASRVAVWIRTPGAFAYHLEVRPGWSNGQDGAAVELTEVWSEGENRIFAADLETVATRLRLTVEAEAFAVIDELRWAAAIAVDPANRRTELSEAQVAAGSAVHPRSAWGAAPAVCGGTEEPPVDRVSLYAVRSTIFDEPSFLRALQAFHQKGLLWCDIRLNYVAGVDGTWLARGDRMGAHAPSRSENSGHLGVAVLGCDAPDAIRQLLDELLARHPSLDAGRVVADEACLQTIVDDWRGGPATKGLEPVRATPVPATFTPFVATLVPPEPDPEPDPKVSVIDHAYLIDRFGGNNADPMSFPETQSGFQSYLDAVGVTYFSASEYVVPHNPGVAADCGYTILLPERSWWPKAAALGLLADQLRALVNEPVILRNWWRPPCYNSGVGGAAGGDHPDADALDLDFASARSRADAQRYLCEQYWSQDFVDPADIAPGSNLNPRLNMSVGLGGVTIHLGLLSRNGRRYWKYASYTELSNSGNCW